MAAVRQANATWEGNLTSGKGVVTAASSGAFTSLPVSWASRTEGSEGQTSPEELVAAAHASCFCMALSHGLNGAGTPPDKLEVSASVTFDKVGDGFGVVSSALTWMKIPLRRPPRLPRMGAPSPRPSRTTSLSA